MAAATGGVALLLMGPVLLPDRKNLAGQGDDDGAIFLTEVRLREDYPSIGRPIHEIAALNRRGIEIVGIRARSGVKRDGLREYVLELATGSLPGGDIGTAHL